jgi:hypothetical protein
LEFQNNKTKGSQITLNDNSLNSYKQESGEEVHPGNIKSKFQDGYNYNPSFSGCRSRRIMSSKANPWQRCKTLSQKKKMKTKGG